MVGIVELSDDIITKEVRVIVLITQFTIKKVVRFYTG